MDIGEDGTELKIAKDGAFMQVFNQQATLFRSAAGEKLLKTQLGVAGIPYARGNLFNKQLALLNLTEWTLGKEITDPLEAAAAAVART